MKPREIHVPIQGYIIWYNIVKTAQQALQDFDTTTDTIASVCELKMLTL